MQQNNDLLKIEFNYDETKLDEYLKIVKDWCLTNGLIILMKSSGFIQQHDIASPLPVTLFPTKYPREEFEYAMEIQKYFNLIVNSIANDYELLRDSLKDVILVDDFTRRLWELCEKVTKEGISQPLVLGILRNDYILDQNKENEITQLSQVEINTISCSFGSATSKVNKLHEHLLRITNNNDGIKKQVPNENLTNLAKAIVRAWNAYNNPKSIVAFIVLDDERNIGDQRLLEYKCMELDANIRIVRFTLSEIGKLCTLDTVTKALLVNGKDEISLVYYRAGYDPSHYTSESDWDARLLIERSKAIKCPNINYHLAGTKKIQQILFENKTLINKYLNNPDIADKIRATFVEQYSFKDENKDDIIKLMLDKSENYVLKPQREGGGNNIYKGDIKTFYESLETKSDLKGYILMRLIKPYLNENVIMKSSAIKDDLINEIGIFGIILSNGKEILQNESTGYLLRSKSSSVNEGGVATGYSALDSIYLI